MNLIHPPIALALGLLLCPAAAAGDRIAVLDFELNDLTLLPRTPQELARTARVAPLLRQALAESGHESLAIAPATQAKANAAFGYLYDHPEIAADLARGLGAEWIAVGRVHKPSFLFAYLKVHLVNARTGRLVGDYAVEVKGDSEKLTARGTANLAGQIDRALRPNGGPPAPRLTSGTHGSTRGHGLEAR
jgi:hypothetical protein